VCFITSETTKSVWEFQMRLRAFFWTAINHNIFRALSAFALVSTVPTPAWCDPITIFSGPAGYTLPETITAIPAGFGTVGGSYFVPDNNSGQLLVVPAAGGSPTVFATIPGGIVSGLIVPAGYGSISGSYLVTGTGSAATVGPTGTVTPLPGTPFGIESSTVAPAGFGSAGGKILLGTGTGTGAQILVLNPDGTTSVLATFGTADTEPFTLGFAPAGFGSIGGDLLATDGESGKVYAIDASGNVSLFDTLPVPAVTDDTTGLRQFAFAPSGYGSYGGDLFVSVSGSSDGGGSLGSVDIVNGSGGLVGELLEGTVGQPYDPRGLYFASNTQLLVGNAEPGEILSVTQDNFTSTVTPEPSSVSLLSLGICGIVALRMGARNRRQA
jgi:hypothetical protein